MNQSRGIGVERAIMAVIATALAASDRSVALSVRAGESQEAVPSYGQCDPAVRRYLSLARAENIDAVFAVIYAHMGSKRQYRGEVEVAIKGVTQGLVRVGAAHSSEAKVKLASCKIPEGWQSESLSAHAVYWDKREIVYVDYGAQEFARTSSSDRLAWVWPERMLRPFKILLSGDRDCDIVRRSKNVVVRRGDGKIMWFMSEMYRNEKSDRLMIVLTNGGATAESVEMSGDGVKISVFVLGIKRLPDALGVDVHRPCLTSLKERK